MEKNLEISLKKAAAMVALSTSIGVSAAGAIGCGENLSGMKEAESEVYNGFCDGYKIGIELKEQPKTDYEKGYVLGYDKYLFDKTKETGVNYVGIMTNEYDINYASLDALTAIYTNEENSKYYVIENYENEQIIESGKYENLLTGNIINENIVDFNTIDFATYINNAYGENYYEEYSLDNLLIVNSQIDKCYFETIRKTK